MKKEVLKAISTIKVQTSDFEHNLMPNNYSIALSEPYEFESENYMIELILLEYIVCDNYGNIDKPVLDVKSLKVYDAETNFDADSITNEEIINQLNY